MLLTRTYSHHSLLSAIPKIPELVTKAKELGYTSIALTDEDTGSGFVEFYEECLKKGVKPILGATLRIPNSTQAQTGFGGRNKIFSKVSILAKNKLGYQSLLELISIARIQRENPDYHILLSDLKDQIEKNGDNFYILLCGNDHELVANLREGRPDLAKNVLQTYLNNFSRKSLLVELAYPLKEENKKNNQQLNQTLIDFCEAEKVKLIASPAPRYLEQEKEEAFQVVLAIKKQTKLYNINLERDFSLPSKEMLAEMFNFYPPALETQEIENAIDIKLRTDYDNNASEAFFPKFSLPPNQEPNQRLTWETYIGLMDRFHPDKKGLEAWKEVFPYEKIEELKLEATKIQPDTSLLKSYPKAYWQEKNILDYIQRIEHELAIIIQKGYPEYFLVFGDIMRFCRQEGIVTNTRGSAAGSLVGYLNQINVLDPLIYNLPFERFLNPFRPSPPDIDGDFADDRRQDVINYIINTYGKENVSQIITFGTMLPRAAVRDVGRVLGVSYKKCDRLAKLIPIAPQGRKTTFAWAFDTSSELRSVYETDEDSKRIIDISQSIEGNYRHSSSHAAGIIITPNKLTDYVPIQWDTEHQMPVAQFDMKYAEKAGLIKLDILGITNLAILGNAVHLTETSRNIKIDLLNIDIQDQKAFELLAKGRTMGTFQLSGGGMTKYLVELEPNRVEDLMAMVALYRPGPMSNIPEFIKRKKNPKLIKYFVPEMKTWMESTYGILVYQEDLLLTAINIAGYNWGEADVLRKGMGKKIKEVIEGQHPKFVQGCIEHGGLSKEKAEEIWQAFLPFAAYGFNKSHSASYGMVAYWTAYMKAEYPVEFMTAYMTAESNNLDRIAKAIEECREMGIEVKPPDINKSVASFSIENNKTIRYGFGSIKNLGNDVIKFIISERESGGNFSDLEDFLERVSKYSGFNKRGVDALILSGCLDELGAEAYKKSPN